MKRILNKLYKFFTLYQSKLGDEIRYILAKYNFTEDNSYSNTHENIYKD
jgi:hypothetical protein